MDAMLRLGIEKTIFSFGACAGAAVACRSKSAARRKDRRARNLFERQNRSVINAGNLSTGRRIEGRIPGLPIIAKTAAMGRLSIRSEERRVGKECRSRWS